MSATTPPAGWITETGSGTFSSADALVAARIEVSDRETFLRLRSAHPGLNCYCRDFLPGERQIRAAMGCPIGPTHRQMVCVLAADGGIDRRPITAEAVARLAREVGK